jgi:hypothetical protein
MAAKLLYLHEEMVDPDLKYKLIRDDVGGHYFRSREYAIHENVVYGPSVQQRVLHWLKTNISRSIPKWYYNLVLGHDLHISVYAELYIKHFHSTMRDPFTGEMGWLENVGRVSVDKVTTAFRDFEIDQLIAETSAYGDFKFHEVGTGNTAEANSQTALITPSGIARATGTQVEASASVYRSVATVTADATETWEEHGIFNASTSGTMLDRSLPSPAPAVVASDTVQFTYELTKAAEA